jgi:crotonobetainyl-CoA:carnitine CoA-transferase CaiB-like acyl-CoA transferase
VSKGGGSAARRKRTSVLRRDSRRYGREMRPTLDDSSGPLAGIRVVDLSDTFMAPYATLLLAQMGAEVIKIELPQGDVTRQIGDVTATGCGPVFINVNRGKQSIVLDLRQEADYQTFTDLISESDVFVHNRRPQAATRLRIDYGHLRTINHRLVHASAFGYGSDGPYANRAAYDDVIQAACGLASIQSAGGPPTYVRSVIVDKTTGLMLFGSILAALFEREHSGEGQAVEVPMFETMVSFLLLEQQGGLVFDPPRGVSGYARLASPYRRPYRTSDGLLSVLVYTDAQWKAFFDLVGQPHLADDPRYSTMRARTDNVDALYAQLEEALVHRSTEEWLARFEEDGIPASPMNSIDDLMEDPQVTAVGLLQSDQHPLVGTVRTARLPVAFSRTPLGRISPAPALGEHDDAIRAWLEQRTGSADEERPIRERDRTAVSEHRAAENPES